MKWTNDSHQGDVSADTDTDVDVPERYRPSHAGTVTVSAANGSVSTRLTQIAVAQLDVTAGDVVSWLPRDERTVRALPGRHTGALATTTVYIPTQRSRQTGCTVPTPALKYIGVAPGDTLRFDWPADRSNAYIDAVGVVDDGD